MPFYLTQAKLSSDSVKALLANPQDRSAAVGKLLESVGGKLHHHFYTFGEYDVVSQAPDNASAAAAVMAAAGSGAVSDVKTTVLMTMDEAVAAMKKGSTASSAYQRPGA